MKKEQITSRNPKVMNGALVFAGTRVPVESLIQHLTAGDSLNKFLDDFPTVSREQAVAYLKMTLEVAEKMTKGRFDDETSKLGASRFTQSQTDMGEIPKTA